LTPTLTSNARLTSSAPAAWTLEIPPGPKGHYRLAQLDDYSSLSRKEFPWRPPLTLSLQARVSEAELPGTWGFGFWNDPFSLSLGFGGGSRRFPALPNAAWFFFASPQNYLSLRDDLPARGFLAATFRSPACSPPVLAIGILGLPLLIWKPTARLLRQLASRIIRQDAALANIEVTRWHHYSMNWQADSIRFFVDNEILFETSIIPRPPLGFVLWLDNQYAALPPNGCLAYGTLSSENVVWLQVKDVEITNMNV